MKIQLKSDLHLEFSQRYTRSLGSHECSVHPDADVLVLAGDITTSKGIDYMLYQFKDIKIPILYVPGNHEYYGNTPFSKVSGMMKDSFKDTNITLLDTRCVLVDGVAFMGATLWTNLSNPMDKLLVDNFGEVGKSIKGLNSSQWHNNNINQTKAIEEFCSTYDSKKVVITHYLPSTLSVPLMYKNDSSNAAFVNNMEYLMLDEDIAPDFWFHGHTHDSCDYVIGGTRVVCNPFGYFPSCINPEYNNDLLVEL